MARKMPKQKPGKSETIVRTPPDFIQAVMNFLDVSPQFSCDLAALKDNAVCSVYISPVVNSLTRKWEDYSGWCWLNPPYDKIAPWVEKAYKSSRRNAKIAVLVPAAVGTRWWRKWVHKKAQVFIVGRLYFLDKYGDPIASPKTGKPTPYPKDLALLIYDHRDTLRKEREGNIDWYDYLDWKEF